MKQTNKQINERIIKFKNKTKRMETKSKQSKWDEMNEVVTYGQFNDERKSKN